jgi:hypothetical protein
MNLRFGKIGKRRTHGIDSSERAGAFFQFREFFSPSLIRILFAVYVFAACVIMVWALLTGLYDLAFRPPMFRPPASQVVVSMFLAIVVNFASIVVARVVCEGITSATMMRTTNSRNMAVNLDIGEFYCVTNLLTPAQ